VQRNGRVSGDIKKESEGWAERDAITGDWEWEWEKNKT